MDTRAALAIILGVIAAAGDLRRCTIPNWLCVCGTASGFMWQAWTKGWSGALTSGEGTLAGFGVFLIFYCLGGMGAGDVKLMAAFGALLGPSGILLAAVITAMVGALIAMVCVLVKCRRSTIPYAPAIVLGAWLALLAGR